MIKGIVTGLRRLIGRKPIKDDAPSLAVFAQAVNETALQPWQQEMLDVVEKAINEDQPLIVNHDHPARRRGKSVLPQMVVGNQVKVTGSKRGKPRDEAFIDATVAAIQEIQADGITSLNAIANELNLRGFKSRQGGRFYAATVKDILAYRGLQTPSRKRKRKSSKAAPAIRPNEIKGMNTDLVIIDDPFPGNRDKEGVVSKKTYGKRADIVIVDDPVNMPAPTKDQYDTLMGMLSPRTRARADIVRRNKQAGGKLLSAEEITEIERRVAAGQVVRYPAGLDSKGVNHFTGENAA